MKNRLSPKIFAVENGKVTKKRTMIASGSLIFCIAGLDR